MDRILTIFASMRSDDFLDIFAVSLIFYAVFTLLRESRSFTALRGLIALIIFGLLVWILANVSNLTATKRILQESLTLVVIIFVILFQNELKRALTDFGQTSILGWAFRTETFDADEIVKAVVRMAERKVGALIAIERRSSLGPYVEVGTQVDAKVSAELLRTIFALGTPLHDGAVIVRNNKIAAAGCLLPLSENPKISKDLGTRHRAGIGLTEETDAIAIICSEETGQISLAYEGKLDRNENAESLRQKLKTFLDIAEETDG